jgi:hypothetical protein
MRFGSSILLHEIVRRPDFELVHAERAAGDSFPAKDA